MILKLILKQEVTGTANLALQPTTGCCHLANWMARSQVHWVAAPRVLNSLPQHLMSAPSLVVFRSRLKTHLFMRCFPWLYRSLVVPEKWHVNRLCYLLTYLLSYLLTYAGRRFWKFHDTSCPFPELPLTHGVMMQKPRQRLRSSSSHQRSSHHLLEGCHWVTGRFLSLPPGHGTVCRQQSLLHQPSFIRSSPENSSIHRIFPTILVTLPAFRPNVTCFFTMLGDLAVFWLYVILICSFLH